MTKVCFEIFVEHLEAHLESLSVEKGILFLDRASNHQWESSGKITLHHLPPACPELNPVERFFKEIRRAMDGKVFSTIEQVEQELISILHQFYLDGDRLAKLTWFPYLNVTF
jgi:transposase